MRKTEIALALVFATLLGIGLSLALNGSGGFAFPRSSGIEDGYTGVVRTGTLPAVDQAAPQEKTPAGPGSQSIGANAANSTAAQAAEQTGEAVPAAPPLAKDIEDVLLLYDTTYPTHFGVNFCTVAEYYGLKCKRLDLATTEIDRAALRDAQGEPYQLIGVDASAVLGYSTWLSEEEIVLLQSAVESGASLFISKVSVDTVRDASFLTRLTAGAIMGVTGLPETHYDWVVSPDVPGVTREFSGQVIASTPTISQSLSTLLTVDSPLATNLILARDQAGESFPVFSRWKKASGAVYVDAGQAYWNLEQIALQTVYYDPAQFTRVVPLMMAMQAVMGEETWRREQDYANLTIDGPTLQEPFLNLSFIDLLGEMIEHNFHTTIAFVPANWQTSEAEVVSLFRLHPERFSLVQHGNNLDGDEFYSFRFTGTGEGEARPVEDQSWDIQEGFSRMELFKNRTHLPYDRVMIFPYGLPPESTLALLKAQNYLAAANIQEIPLDTDRPSTWDFGMYPAILDFESFPLLTRRHPGTYGPFRPTVQPFLFDLFIDKPALFFSHANTTELFADGIAAFNPVADQINQLQGNVEWQGLGTILKQLYLEKMNDDGSTGIQMFSNTLVLSNATQQPRVYHISREDDLSVPVASVTVNGKPMPYEVNGGSLWINLRIPANTRVEIEISYQD